MAFDVAVIGAIGIDTNVYLYTDEVDFSVEANFSQNLDYIGQAGGYSCRGFKKLGYNVAFVGYVGDDYSGRYIRESLEKDGIDTYFGIDPEGTKRSVNIMYGDGRRKNFYDGKGSMRLRPDLLAIGEYLAGTGLVHINLVNWTRYLLPLFKEDNTVVSVDIQDVVSADDPYRQDYIKAADVLFFSAVNFPDPAPLIERFMEIRSDRIVICGMGKRGCALGTEKGISYYRAVELEEPVIDTNGAGDSLAVGFLSSHFLQGHSLEESILRGQIAARYCCSRKATSSDLITRELLDRYYIEKRRRASS
ncbi:MAG TPA: carbohydrate kinase family protein [Mesotoga infera]|nr:carbohydrate kinase family protein [Mesotoga infera]HRR44865.1 carbohydrate kinase family protein [Mesotoga sp.]